ncbi:hypothetical protein QWJ34_23355 [Saccharibacillus sp. CPCC 101409]|uniref:DUF6612 family protein n=1 Tax=Saccharibacillus sp. CPCC 101409 TaxID=3058041 RepID=UPI002673A431|nr:DUF6612 family protein [Saccharibacillus sp. CPCC 101409]MDO3412724.1 hypothetical protein [Saccharibacillus sp. CPCC 101409]
MYSAKRNRNRHYLGNALKMSALSLLLFSAACTSESSTTDPAKESKPSGESTETAASVYDQALEQAKALESYKIDSKTNYTVETADSEEPVETAIEIAGDVIAKPEVQYGLKIDTLSQGQQAATEVYATGSEIHAKDASGAWSTQTLDGSEESSIVTTDILDPAMLIEELSDYKDGLKLSEEGGAYTLTYEAADAEAAKLIEAGLGRQLGESAQSGLSEMLQSSAGSKVSYSLVVDKESHQLSSSSVKMDTTLQVNEQDLHIVANSDGTYSDQNAVSEIAVPAEATADDSQSDKADTESKDDEAGE